MAQIQTHLKLEHDCFLHAQSANVSARTFDMIATAFGPITSYYTAIAPTAFDKHLPNFLSKGFIGGLNHDWDNPIGAPIKAAVEGLFLLVTGELTPNDPNADRLLNLMATKLSTGRAVVQYCSIGGYAVTYNTLGSAEEVHKWWGEIGYTPTVLDLERLEKGLRYWDSIDVITESRLDEVSPCMSPANQAAKILQVRHQEKQEFLKRSQVQHSQPPAPSPVSEEELKLRRLRLAVSARRFGCDV